MAELLTSIPSPPVASDDGPLYGWYSPEAARLYGGCIYTTPTGARVYVTDVSRTIRPIGNEWPDLEPMGKVVKWLGRFEGLHPSPPFHSPPRFR